MYRHLLKALLKKYGIKNKEIASLLGLKSNGVVSDFIAERRHISETRVKKISSLFNKKDAELLMKMKSKSDMILYLREEKRIHQKHIDKIDRVELIHKQAELELYRSFQKDSVKVDG